MIGMLNRTLCGKKAMKRPIRSIFGRLAVFIFVGVALAGCASFRPTDDFPETRARFERDTDLCRDRAKDEAYGKSLPLAGMLFGGFYGVIHGAAAGAGVGSTAEGALVGAAVGAGTGFILGLGASIVKYDKAFDSCMESRGHSRA